MLFFALDAGAQDSTNKTKSTLNIRGVVQDTAGKKIPNAVLFIYGDTIHSDSTGRFKINVTKGDSVVIKAKGYYTIGYRPKSDTSAITLLPLPVDTFSTTPTKDSTAKNTTIQKGTDTTINNNTTNTKDSSALLP
ncbi:MAG: hypothetical protein DI598_15490, partial [Pseudopedobacter saltans]